MTTIPRRLVYRAIAAIVWNQARTVAGRTAGRSVKRRGLAHEANAQAKEQGRKDQAHDLRVQANELTRRIGNPNYYQDEGEGVAPELLGWLACLALGHTEARAEIARLADKYVLESVDWLDMPMVLDRLLTTAREEGDPIYD